MSGVDKGGLVGESARTEWQGDVSKQEHEEREREFRKQYPLPKGMKSMAMPHYEPPWTSLGQAPTEEQVKRNADEGA